MSRRRRDTTPRSSLIWHRDFRRLWEGQSVSELGSQVSVLALPLVAVLTLHATTFEVGALTASSTAAFLLVGLPAGAWVDRLRRRNVMIWADIGRAVTFASVPVAAAIGVLTIWQLFAVALIGGVLTVFFDVAYQSYLPFLVGRPNLVEANSKLQGSSSVASVVGPSAAGGLIELVRAANSMAVDAASFVVSVVTVWSIRGREPAPIPSDERRSLRSEIAEGLSFVLRHPILRAIAGTTSTSNFFSAVQGAVWIVFLVRVLHQPAGIIGLLFGAGSVGGILGAFAASRVARLVGGARATIWAIGTGSVGGLLLPLSMRGAGLGLFAFGMFMASFGALVYNVNQVSFRQRLCPERLLGRMNATMRFLVWGTLPLGALLGGLLGASIGVRNAMWVGGGGGTLAILWLLFSPIRPMRDFLVEHDDGSTPVSATTTGDGIALDGSSEDGIVIG
jgi:predicted MFS family arabinose efflux permease